MDTLTQTTTNYAAMPFEELLAHKKALDAAYESKKGEAQAAFFERFRKEAADLGIELGKVAHAQKSRRSPPKASAAPVRYRNPSNLENTWSGRGKPRKWLQELIDAGKDKEDFKVEA